jgi:hypothetical protein
VLEPGRGKLMTLRQGRLRTSQTSCTAKHLLLVTNLDWDENHEGAESNCGEALMTTMQAIFLGMMLSWTPSIVLLAWLLWRDDVGLDRNLTGDFQSKQLNERPS